LTARFVLKVLSVFLVAGAVFWYYYWDMKDKEPPGNMKFFEWAVVSVVAIGVMGAFFVMGSPQTERLRRFDEQRVSDLQNIQWQIVNYWQKKQMLPADLSLLNDDIGGFRVPVDPETKESYEYEIHGALLFTLCAEFMTSNTNEKGVPFTRPAPYMENDIWDHGTGRTCFERTIDPDLYPVRDGIEKPVPVRL